MKSKVAPEILEGLVEKKAAERSQQLQQSSQGPLFRVHQRISGSGQDSADDRSIILLHWRAASLLKASPPVPIALWGVMTMLFSMGAMFAFR